MEQHVWLKANPLLDCDAERRVLLIERLEPGDREEGPFRPLAAEAARWAAELGDVLRAGAEWKAIDPKPLVGERAFDLASLLRDRRPVTDARIVRRRLDLLTDLLDVDRERARGWGIVHALAWGIEDESSTTTSSGARSCSPAVSRYAASSPAARCACSTCACA